MSNLPLNYQGPSNTYESYIDGLRAQGSGTSNSKVGFGYADIEFLREELERLESETKYFYEQCVLEMQNYTLKLDTSDETLIKSHQMSYPDDDTPDSISFKEYIYNYSVAKSTSSLYVNRYYENKVRGIYGTNALDIAHIIKIMHSEVIRIGDFLDKYTGDIDDPTEFRTIEAFQNWAQNAKNLLEGYRAAFEAKGLSGLSRNELAELDETKAREFQGLFQSKLNILNSAISDIISQLYKDWDTPSGIFYDKVLGPSLKFSLKISRNITSGLDPNKAPTLYKEADMTRLGLNSQFASALDDQIKRNQLFYDYLQRLFSNILQRDTYIRYLDQLSTKGKVIPNPFMTQFVTEPEVIFKAAVELGVKSPTSFDSNASSDHSFLTGTDNPDAHSQYVLKTGDIVTGPFEVYGPLKLNGFDLTQIFQYNEDGTVEVKTNAIDWSNVDSSQLYGSGDPARPRELTIINRRVLADGKLEYTIEFSIEENNAASYEFEIIEL